MQYVFYSCKWLNNQELQKTIRFFILLKEIEGTSFFECARKEL